LKRLNITRVPDTVVLKKPPVPQECPADTPIEIEMTAVQKVPEPTTILAAPPRSMSNVLDVPWCEAERFEPDRVEDVLIREQTANEFCSWLQTVLKRKTSRRLCVLAGPSGTGKRTLTRVACRNMGIVCEEPKIFSLVDFANVVLQDTGSSPLKMADTSISPLSCWFFSGVDGILQIPSGKRALCTPAKIIDKLLKLLSNPSITLSPIVLAIYDFDSADLRRLRKSPFVFVLRTYRLDLSYAKSRRDLNRCISDICIRNNLPRAVLNQALLQFDGDLKQMMLAMEFAYRRIALPDEKDVEDSNVFDVARKLLNTAIPTFRIPPDYYAEVMTAFPYLETILWNNVLDNPPQNVNMDSVAIMYDAWHDIAAASGMYADATMRRVFQTTALLRLRISREHLRWPHLGKGGAFQSLKTLPRDKKMHCIHDLRELDTKLYGNLESMERMELLRMQNYKGFDLPESMCE